MVNVEFNKKNVYVGVAIVLLLMFGTTVYKWQYDRDYSTLYENGTIIARHRWYVEMERTYTNVKYPYQRDNCLEIEGARLTDTRCYYPDNYYVQLNRKLQGYIFADVSHTEFNTHWGIYRNTPYFKYGTKGTIAGELEEEFIHLKNVSNIKDFPNDYKLSWNPRDGSKYKLVWKITHLKDITLDSGTYNDCVYSFGNILINFTNDCDMLDYVQINKEKEELLIYFQGTKGKQILYPTIVDPPLKISKKDVFKQLKLNNGKNKVAEFVIDSPTSMPKSKLTFKFNEVYGKVKDYQVLIKDTCTKNVSEPVYATTEQCFNQTGNFTKQVKEVCHNNTYIDYYNISNISYDCWKEFDYIPYGVKDYRIEANIEYENVNGNLKYSVDWVPTFETFSKSKLIMTEWAWWNSSYTYKREIENLTTSDIAVAVNGTTGWEINFSNYIVWTNPSQCGGTMQLYYNNDTDFAVTCNDTTLMNYGEEISGKNYNNNFSGIYNTNIVLAYHFGNSTTAAWDTSGNDNNGTVNGATYTTSGKYGGAFDFDGSNDWIDSGSITCSNTRSISTWVKHDTGTCNFYDGIVGNLESSPTRGGFLIRCDHSLDKYSAITSNDAGSSLPVIECDFNVDTNWHHIATTYSGTNFSIYCDGEYKDSVDITIGTGCSNLEVGRDSDQDARYFNGQIDDVRIYSDALTSTEIEQLYNNSQQLNMQLGEEEGEEAGTVIITNSTINFTSGLTDTDKYAWNQSPRVRANTTDTTPGLTFNTSINSSCRVGNSDINYTSSFVDDSFNYCNDNDNDKTIFHNCTYNQGFGIGNQELYVSCATFGTDFDNLLYLWNDTLLYYPMDNDYVDSNTIIDINDNINGTKSSTVESNVTGILKEGVKFNSSSESITSTVNFNDSQDFTIGWWMKLDNNPQIALPAVTSFVTLASGTSNALSIIADRDINPNAIKIEEDNGLSSSITITGTNYDIGTWNLYYIIYNHSETRYYVYQNNSLLGSSTLNKNLDTLTTLYIGKGVYSNVQSFNGTIDEFFIVNKTLNSSERSNIYNSGLARNYFLVPADFEQESTGSTSGELPLTLLTNINITLNSPENDSELGSGNVTFNFTIGDNTSVTNCSLYDNFTGTWNINQTLTTGLNQDEVINFEPVYLTLGTYLWNVQCCESTLGTCEFADNNFTLNIIDEFPLVNLIEPVDDSVVFFKDNPIILNYTATDDMQIDNCSLYTNHSGSWLLENTTSFSTDLVTGNFSRYFDRKSIIWNVECCDSSNQCSFNATNYSLTINNTNPVWTNNVSNFSILEDSGESTILTNLSDYVTDADADSLTFGVYNENVSEVDCEVYNSTGSWSLNVTPFNNYTGNASCTLNVSDSFSSVTGNEFGIEVNNTNDLPFFDPPLEDQQAFSLSEFSYNINCTDIDPSDTITYTDNSSLFIINSSTGLINFTPLESEAGSYSILVTCSDSVGSTSDNFTLTINDTIAPRIFEYNVLNNPQDYCETNNFNITFIDYNMDNTSVVYYRTNQTGTFVNYSASYVTSLNDTHHVFEYNTTSAFFTAQVSYYNFYGIDNYDNLNNTMDVQNFNVTQNVTTTTLYLDGLSEDRKYELSYGSNLTGVLRSCSDETIYLNIDYYNFGTNFTNDTDSDVYYNLNLSEITETEFNDSTSIKNLTVNLTNSSYIEITGDAIMTSSQFNVSGYLYDSSYPKNIKIDMLNDGIIDKVLVGQLIGKQLYQNVYDDNKSVDNVTFVNPGTQVRYINYTVNSGFDEFENITMYLEGFAVDPIGVDFTDYFFNDSNIRNNTCQGPEFIYDDFSLGDSGNWNDASSNWNIPYQVITDNYIESDSGVQTVTSGTQIGYGRVFESNINLLDYNQIDLQGNLFSYSRGCEYCSGTNGEGVSNAYIQVYDKTAGSNFITLKSVSTSESGAWWGCNEDSESDTSTFNVKKEDGFLKAYDDNVLISQKVYDSSHEYTIRFGGTYQISALGTCVSANGPNGRARSRSRINYINLSGVKGTGNLSSYSNCTITWDTILNTTENITKAYVDIEYDLESGTGLDIFLSPDNGTNWESTTDETFHTFTNDGTELLLRLNLTTTDNTKSTTVKTANVEVVPGFVTGLSIDVGYDGDNEYRYNESINSTNPINATIEVGKEIDSYIFDNCLEDLTCRVPIAFRADTSGTIQTSNLNFTMNLSDLEFNSTLIENNVTGQDGTVDIEFFFNSTNKGIINVSDLNFQYKSDDNVSVTAIFYGNENYTASNDTQVMSWRYSPITVSFPTGISAYNVYPSTVNSKQVSPWGQLIRINESESESIWNITSTAKKDKVKVYYWYNPAVDSCLTLYSCLFYNLTECFTINSSQDTVIVQNLTNTSTGDYQKVYDFWNLTSCDPTNLFLPGTFTHRAICQDCVKTW